MKNEPLPTLHELLNLRDHTWYFESEEELDNYQAMDFFLDEAISKSKNADMSKIEIFRGGSYAEIDHKDYSYILILDSSGRGDPYSHIIETYPKYKKRG